MDQAFGALHPGDLADLVEHEKKACRASGDMSLRLIGLAYYAKDETWENDLGEVWSVERLVEQELHQPIAGAPPFRRGVTSIPRK
jgi:hypothetical protein